MLATTGAQHIRDLFSDIPDQFHLKPGSLNLPEALHEAGIVRKFTRAAEANRHAGNTRCFLGGGTYHHFIPAVVDYVISRGEFLTAYTPYQPEIAQGTLQTLFEFQTMTARLLGMEVANASMYDAATAMAEAALMAQRITRRSKVITTTSVNSRYRDVTRNYLSRLGVKLVDVPCTGLATELDSVIAAVDTETACVIVQYPDFYGSVYDLQPLREACDATGALMIVAFADASCFGLITPPGDFGADIVIGSGQALGIPMGFGGPHIGLFACRQKYVRQVPGRVCGMTEDKDGKRGFVLTLSTREQHIRREKATSNICSNQGLMCTANATYLSLMGDAGLATVARHSAAALAKLTASLPDHVEFAGGARFHETVISFADQKSRDGFIRLARERHIFAGIPLEAFEPEREPCHLLVATTEMTEAADIEDYSAALQEAADV